MTAPITTAAFLLPLASVAETLPVLFGRDGQADWPGQIVAAHDRIGFCAGLVYLTRARTEIVGMRVCIPGEAARVTSYPLADLAIDLSAPSVAARVAGLCARALGSRSGAFTVAHYGAVVWLASLSDSGWRWVDGAPYAGHDRSIMPHLEPADCVSAASFLAALFLSLAPRIAALGVPRD